VGVDRIWNVAEARRRARLRLPRVVFDYIDGDAEDGITHRRNTEDYNAVTFQPRTGNKVAHPSLVTEVFGTKVSMPVLLAPCGLTRVMHPDGTFGIARAAASRGTIQVLSTVAGNSPEDVAWASTAPKWFQLYASGGLNEAAEAMIDRARLSGYEALVVTMDTAVLGNRERDSRNGIQLGGKPSPAVLAKLLGQFAVKPRWSLSMAAPGIEFVKAAKAGRAAGAQAGVVGISGSPFSWDDVAAIRGRWPRRLVVKGLMTADDARRAVDAGADGIVVSNHGGRQLDGSPPTPRVLPAVVDAVGDSTVVMVDSGLRRGTHVVKALAMGAKVVFIGRAYLYGFAVGGQAGVERVLDVFRAEISRTMTLLGCQSVADLDRSWLDLSWLDPGRLQRPAPG